MKQLISLICLGLIVSGCSERPEVLSQCGREHGNHAIERWQCILALDAERAKEEKKIIREKNARECIAKKINGLENKVKEISNSIQEKSTFYEVENILKSKADAVQKTFSSQDIKVPVLIATIRTECDSEFYILINVSGYEPDVNHDYEISSLQFYAMNAPSGYNFLSHTLSKPFHEDRILARRFEVEKKQREIMAELEKNGSKKKSSYLDPCALGISSEERLKRLKQFGEVRQTGPGDYEAGRHQVSLFSADNSLIYCR